MLGSVIDLISEAKRRLAMTKASFTHAFKRWTGQSARAFRSIHA